MLLARRRTPERFVFTDAVGGPIRRSNLQRRSFKPLLTRGAFGRSASTTFATRLRLFYWPREFTPKWSRNALDIRPSPHPSSVLKNAARLLQSHDTRQRGVKDAGKRSRAGWDVQLRLDGGADSRGSSVARGEADGGRSASRPLEKVRVALLHHGSPLDSAGAALAGAAAAGALLGPQRAAAGGAARVQPAFSLVRGTHDG